MRPSDSALWPSLTRWGIGRLVTALSRVAHALPDPTAVRLGEGVGDLLLKASARYRRVTLANLRQVFGGEWTEEQIQTAARDTLRNIGKSAVEFLRMDSMTDRDVLRMTDCEGREHLDAALARGKGVLIATAHFGNWEMLGAWLAANGYVLHVVARDADDEATNRLINGIREKRGYHVISRDSSMKPILLALRRNELVGILSDQNYMTGIFVPFFGRLAATATGAAALARSTGAAVVPSYCVRQRDNTLKMVFKPAMQFQTTDDKEADVARITAQITADIEETVRQYPTQWFWIHDRWKHRPPEECEVGSAKS